MYPRVLVLNHKTDTGDGIHLTSTFRLRVHAAREPVCRDRFRESRLAVVTVKSMDITRHSTSDLSQVWEVTRNVRSNGVLVRMKKYAPQAMVPTVASCKIISTFFVTE